jgi:hypothetical protein
MRSVWTTEQIAFLKANYETMKTKELLTTLADKTGDQLRWKAKEFRLQKRVTRSKADMTWLEDFDDPESCYWWGFITADGCITDRQLILSVHERDEAHLRRFCEKSGSKISRSTKLNSWHPKPYTMVRTALSDRFTLERLKRALSIENRKTYSPLDVSVFCTSDRLAYFMAGLIDGDGSIYVGPNRIISIRIKVHPNWTEPFRLLCSKLRELYGITATVHFTNKGWVYINMSQMRHIVRLYDLIDGRVPCLDRKWKQLDSVRLHCSTSNDGRIGKIGPNPSANFRESSLPNELSI